MGLSKSMRWGRGGLFALLVVLAWWPGPACGFSVATLGDHAGVTVLKADGDYAELVDGQMSHAPRQAVAREFLRNHGDDYDFLIVFTDFDVPEPNGARAFYTPVRNDVEGLGIEPFDHSPGFSPDGGPLQRLQGIIDMTNLHGQATDPLDPDFDKTLLTLTHELMHRWGAYVSFIDDAGEQSDALLGLDRAHWSFLLDSAGSTLYGNHWRDNGDGTFTTVAPDQAQTGQPLGRLLSPLDLYLMGLKPAEQVPELRLIDSPGIDTARLPELGITIPGRPLTVGIDQIIAAHGPRWPDAEDARKRFRFAFIYLVAADAWTAAEPQAQADLARLRQLRDAWEQRFAILTDGQGEVSTELVVPTSPSTNPGPPQPVSLPAAEPHVELGVAWLASRQQADGSWRDRPGSEARSTAAAVKALTAFASQPLMVQDGRDWLARSVMLNCDDRARRLLAGERGALAALLAGQNADGGWGSAAGYRSNPFDTAMALLALVQDGAVDALVTRSAVDHLLNSSNVDGGWPAGAGPSLIQATAYSLAALLPFRDDPLVTQAVLAGSAWLVSRQQVEGGFGAGQATVIDTALSLVALKAAGGDPEVIDRAVDWLVAGQSASGSWQASPFQTALAVDALYTGQVAADLMIVQSELRFTPAPVEAWPGEVQVAAAIGNLGGTAVEQVEVALYQGTVSAANLRGVQQIAVPAHSQVDIAFDLSVLSPFDQWFTLVIDPAGAVSEASRANNLATATLSVDLPAPTVGFATAELQGFESAPARLPVVLEHPWDQPVTVAYAANATGTASTPADYLQPAGSLTFSPGETEQFIEIVLIDDLDAEPVETIVVELVDASTGRLGRSSLSYTIRDNDTPPAVSFVSPGASDWEEQATVTVEVALDFPWDVPLTVELAVEPGGTATRDEDFLGGEVSLSFPPGETRRTMTLTIIDDPLVEVDESLQLRLQNPQGCMLGAASWRYTIRDNDTPPRLSWAPLQAANPEGVSPVTFRATLEHAWQATASVGVEVDPAGSATRLEDYRLPTTLLEFLPGEKVRDLVIEIVDDVTVEADESIQLRLVDPVGIELQQDRLDYLIVNDDIPPTVTISAPVDGALLSDNTPRIGFQLSHGEPRVLLDGDELTIDSGESLVEVLPDGDYLLRVEARDAVGRTGVAEARFTIDTTPPQLQIVSPLPGRSLDPAPRLFYLSDSDDVQVLLNGEPQPAVNGALLPALADGEYRLELHAVDAAGNPGLAAVEFSIRTREELPPAAGSAPEPLTLVDSWAGVSSIERDPGQFKLDAAGNRYVFNTLHYYGQRDMEVAKYDRAGNFVWSQLIDSGFDDQLAAYALAPCGSTLFVAGLTKSRGCFDGSGSCAGYSYTNPVLVRIDDLGNTAQVAWTREWGGLFDDNISDLLVDDAGRIFVTGWHEESQSYYDQNWYTFSRFDSAGNQLIDTHRETPSYCAQQAYGDRLYCGLYSYDKQGSPFPPGSYPDGVSRLTLAADGYFYGGRNGQVVRVDGDGTVRWESQRLTAAPDPLIAYPLGVPQVTMQRFVADRQGAVYAFGVTNGSLPGYVYRNKYHQGSQFDLFIAKYDGYGRLVWWQQFGGDGNDQFGAVEAEANGDILFVHRYLTPGGSTDRYSYDTYRLVPDADEPAAGSQAVTYHFASSSACRQAVTSKGAAVTSLSTVAGECTGPDEVRQRFSGGPVPLLFGYRTEPYPQPTLIESRFGGNLFTLEADSAGEVTVELVEVAPADGTVLQSFGAVTRSFAAGLVQVGDLAGLSGVVAAGNSFGLQVSVEVAGRGVQAVRYGQAETCPAGGRQQVSLREVPVELEAPTSSILTPVVGAELTASYVLISGVAADTGGSGVARVEVSTDGGVSWVAAVDTSLDRSWATWSQAWIQPALGPHLLVSRAIDRDGNFEGGLVAVNVTVESPVGMLKVDPVPVLTNLAELLLSGSKGDGASLAVTALPSGESLPVKVAGTSWTCLVASLQAGENRFAVTSQDASGRSLSETVTVTYDPVPPELTVAPVASPLWDDLVTIAGTVEAGATLVVTTAGAASTGAVARTGEGWSCPIAGLVPGDNQVVISAVDAAGNQSQINLVLRYQPPPEMTLALTPGQIDADGAVALLLEIGSLLPMGSEVMIEQFAADSDGPVLRRFMVIDGLTSIDPNVPGDEDGLADGRLIVTLNGFQRNDRTHAPGVTLFRASGPYRQATARFEVLPPTVQQSIDGYLFDAEGIPVRGAVVKLTDPWGRSHGFALTDAAGYYLLKVATPGEYLLEPTAPDMVFDRTAHGPILVGAGAAPQVDLLMTHGDYPTTGRVLDRSTMTGVPGLMVHAENDSSLASAMTERDGSFRLSLPAGTFDLSVDETPSGGLAEKGYLATPDSLANLTLPADAAGSELLLTPAAQLGCGIVENDLALAVAGVPVKATGRTDDWSSAAVSAAGGAFCLGLAAGEGWRVELDDDAQGLGLLGSWQDGAGGEALALATVPIDAWVTGMVRDELGLPVAGLPVRVEQLSAGFGAGGVTAADGSYRLGLSSLPGGDWTVTVAAESFGYRPVPAAVISVELGQLVVQDFSLARPLLNSIAVTAAGYNTRKQLLSVEATSDYPDAQLVVQGLGAMEFSRLFKGKYFWTFSQTLPANPATVTVTGPEGQVTIAVP